MSAGRGPAPAGSIRLPSATSASAVSMSSGSASDRPRPPRHRSPHGALHEFRRPVGAVDLRPFGDRREEAAIVDLLNASRSLSPDPTCPDEKGSSASNLASPWDADRRVGGARTARREGDARPPGQLAPASAMNAAPALLAAGDEAEAFAASVDRVQNGEIRIARHPERRVRRRSGSAGRSGSPAPVRMALLALRVVAAEAVGVEIGEPASPPTAHVKPFCGRRPDHQIDHRADAAAVVIWIALIKACPPPSGHRPSGRSFPGSTARRARPVTV